VADTGVTVWAAGLWADDFWAAGLWAGGDAPQVEAEPDSPTGGWYLDWRDVQEIRRRRKKRQEQLAQLAEEVSEGKLSEVDAQIAEFLKAQEAKDDARKEREKLKAAADSIRQAAVSQRVRKAAEAAATKATIKNLDRFAQELKRHLEDEDISVLMTFLMAEM
jgi:hypothetical protein